MIQSTEEVIIMRMEHKRSNQMRKSYEDGTQMIQSNAKCDSLYTSHVTVSRFAEDYEQMKLNVSGRQTLDMENSRQQDSGRERTFVDYGLSTERTLSLVSAAPYHMRGWKVHEVGCGSSFSLH